MYGYPKDLNPIKRPLSSVAFCLQFSNLDDYALLEVFKYFNFEERLYFARVNKKWCELINRLWLAEKFFNINDSRNCLCSDDFPLSEFRKVISRCPNLSSLDFLPMEPIQPELVVNNSMG
jgi:F-box domain